MSSGNNGNGNQGQSPNGYFIFDNNNTLEYNGAWVYNTFSLPDNPQIQSYHTIADTNASVSVPFYVPSNDFVLRVLGMIPPGDGKVSANYTVDDGEPTTVTLPTNTQETPEYYQQYYASPALEEGFHNLTIKVLETGKGRNYSIDLVKVVSEGIGEGNKPQPEPESEGGDQGSKTAAVVGVVLSSVIFLLVLLVALFVRRKRRLDQSRGGSISIEHRLENAADTRCISPASILSEQTAPVINPYVLPPRESRRASIITREFSVRSINTGSTSLPEYATVDPRSESSLRARDDPSEARASYAPTLNMSVHRTTAGNPF